LLYISGAERLKERKKKEKDRRRRRRRRRKDGKLRRFGSVTQRIRHLMY
jgi:hypothetical protein